MMIIIFVGHCAAFNFGVWLIWRIWRAKIYCSLLVRSRDYSDYFVAIISVFIFSMPPKVVITVIIKFMFLGINVCFGFFS